MSMYLSRSPPVVCCGRQCPPKLIVALLCVNILCLITLTLGVLLYTSPSLQQSVMRYFRARTPPQVDVMLLQAKGNTLEAQVQRMQHALMKHIQESNSDPPLDPSAPFPSPPSQSDSLLVVPSPLSLPTPSHLSALASSPYPRKAIFTLITLSPLYCHSLWVLFKSLRMTDKSREYDFVIMYSETQNNKTFSTDEYCKALYSFTREAERERMAEEEIERQKAEDQGLASPSPPLSSSTLFSVSSTQRVGYVRLVIVPTIKPASWHTVPPRWLYSLNRLEMFRMLEYEHGIYIDADTVIVHSVSALFDLGYDLAAVVDQWDGCDRREVMNGGLLSFRPSLYLYSRLYALFYSKPSCLSQTMIYSDQELINCLCGLAGSKAPGVKDLSCGLIPSWTAMYPKDAVCPFFNAADLLIIHYAFEPKPWEWMHRKCIKEVIEDSDKQYRQSHKGKYEERRATSSCYQGNSAFLSYWHCIDQRGSITLNPDSLCELTVYAETSATRRRRSSQSRKSSLPKDPDNRQMELPDDEVGLLIAETDKYASYVNEKRAATKKDG